MLASPLLYAAAVRLVRGEFDTPTIFWRSSPSGIDLLALVLPNPNHPLAPEAISQWLTKRPQAYIENVVSLPYVALVILILAWRAGWRPTRWWVGMCVTFGLLALGPFVHVAGVNTYVPGPWALLRYVPLVGFVHTPARFAIPFTLFFAIIVGEALGDLCRRHPQQRRALLLLSGISARGRTAPCAAHAVLGGDSAAVSTRGRRAASNRSARASNRRQGWRLEPRRFHRQNRIQSDVTRQDGHRRLPLPHSTSTGGGSAVESGEPCAGHPE